MAVFRPFRAFRPNINNEKYIPSLPYESMSTAEVREKARGNALSFLHVDRSDMDLPDGVEPYSDEIFEKAKENLDMLENTGALRQDVNPCFYIYRQICRGHEQVGLVGCASIDDYLNNNIKKHEKTLEEKEKNIVRYVDATNANTGPIFLTYRKRPMINFLLSVWMNENDPVYDIVYENVEQTVWVIDDSDFILRLSDEFSNVDSLYIADGHHRCASAVEVGQRRRLEKGYYDENDEFNYFLAAVFPDEDLQIMDYNRTVSDLNGLTKSEFIDKVSGSFNIKRESDRYKPFEKYTYGMYLDGDWFSLRAKVDIIDKDDPVKRLDVSILHDNILEPILGITDPKNDQRIDFVSGTEGLGELEKRVYDDMTVAFAICPTTIKDMMDIADAGEIMPPKSTWFEPKLLSGFFVHNLS